MRSAVHYIAAVALLALSATVYAQGTPSESQAVTLRLQVVDTDGEPVPSVHVIVKPSDVVMQSDLDGNVSLNMASDQVMNVSVVFKAVGYTTRSVTATNLQSSSKVVLEDMVYELSGAEVTDQSRAQLSQTKLRDVEGVAIYAGRKNELILLDNLQANLATNNAREIFKGVAGLNVWESDAGGLQLSIGARGLSPNRSSNFNTRQNGFDISADALGYPESYYTPPAQSLQRIELVRGAASLQYGTQFGGLLNFKLKEGDPNRKLTATTEQTVGSYGLLSNFTSVGGTVGKVNYYGFGQWKQGNAWRDNSGYEQATGYLDVHYQATPKLRIGLELTRMAYEAQQPGGLLDFEFERDPRSSKRSRNWFDVDWGLAALHLDYKLSNTLDFNVRTFVLDARRAAVGELGPINRPDPLRERNLLIGEYRNFGQEARLLHRREINGRTSVGVIGMRVYSGLTHNQQGLANAAQEASYNFLNPDELEGSDFDFPSRNFAAFAEQIFWLSDEWSITPGLRYEYIRTASDGYYRQRVQAGNEILLDRRVSSEETNSRSLLIGGLGGSYRPEQSAFEFYANASQNYRAINFSDLVVLNPNLLIDSTLSDERGYNVELGMRGQDATKGLSFDVSLFHLHYANRIGVTEQLIADPVLVEREVSVRTNIGAADLLGLEAYGEAELLSLLGKPNASLCIRPFLNASLIHGRYTSGPSAVQGNRIEYVPSVSLRGGVSLNWHDLSAQVLHSYTGLQYSDATNATLVADATRGIVPAYQVMDLTLGYEWKQWQLTLGCNNVLDQRYFTRRATGYPGPGLIPSEARTVYASLRVSL